jgi:hypothetical protein
MLYSLYTEEVDLELGACLFNDLYRKCTLLITFLRLDCVCLHKRTPKWTSIGFKEINAGLL